MSYYVAYWSRTLSPTAAFQHTSTAALMSKAAEDLRYNACLAVIHQFLTNMNQELAEPLPCTLEITREYLLNLGSRVSHEITKLGLAILNNPSLDTVSPVAENCVSLLTALTCALRSLLPLAGPTMRQQVISTGQGMLENLRALIAELMNKGIQSLSTEQQNALAKRTGMIWDACEALNKLPLHNRDAIGKKLMVSMLLLRDAATELKDLKEQSEEAELNGEDPDLDDEYGAEIDDETRAELERAGLALMRAPKPHERVLFAPTLELYKAAMAPMRSIYGLVLKDERATDQPHPDNLPVSEEHKSYVEWLEKMGDSFDELSGSIDQLGASMYPPHEFDAQNAGILAILNAATNVFELALSAPAGIDRTMSWVETQVSTLEQSSKDVANLVGVKDGVLPEGHAEMLRAVAEAAEQCKARVQTRRQSL